MAKAMRIRTDDMVQVMSGKDAGKQGRVLRAEPKKNRVYVEGLNMVKRHQVARPPAQGSSKDAKEQLGGIIEKEGPIDISNVMVLDPKDNKPTRVGVRKDKGGRRERFAKRSGEAL